ncbi:AbiV family abortive infection protein [Paenarthrobacter nicotinovorans]|uniref:AbiV family abortive infection protein n=1 Tax=Paenarthrobacter nicotinovorans TaxID=29320 RepID=UPI0037FEE517
MNCMQMSPNTARTFWKALMDNATGLIADAHAVLERESFGRARSLTVLAQEELGKALWIYETFERSWNTGAEAPKEVAKLKTYGRHHATKYMEAFVFGQELASFWGDYDSLDSPEEDSQEGWAAFFAERKNKATAAGKHANDEKMAGFYVDTDGTGEAVLSPTDITPGTIAEDLQTSAQVIEMLLIKDHSRMKFYAATPYDSTHEQQHRLLPISHPENWATASEEFKRGDYWKDSGA